MFGRFSESVAGFVTADADDDGLWPRWLYPFYSISLKMFLSERKACFEEYCKRFDGATITEMPVFKGYVIFCNRLKQLCSIHMGRLYTKNTKLK